MSFMISANYFDRMGYLELFAILVPKLESVSTFKLARFSHLVCIAALKIGR